MRKLYSAALILLFPALLNAQEKTQTAKADTTTKLEEVVVVSTRFREKKSDVAQQVQILTARRLQQLNAPTTADALEQTPGILVQKSQLGGGSPVIRGFEANRVLLVVDGVRLNNAIYRGGHLQNVITMDQNSLERIEVGFGPSSVSYGSDALGGVVHFTTKRPQFSKTVVSAFTRYATASDERTGGFSFNFGSRNLASFSNLTYSDFGDLRQGSKNYQRGTESWKRPFYVVRSGSQDEIIVNNDPNVQKQSGYRQIDILQKFLYKTSEKVSQIVNLQYSNSSDVPRYDRLAQVQNNNPSYAEWYYGPQERILASYKLELSGFSGLFDQSNLTGAYQKIKESRHDRRLNNINLNNRTEDLDIFSLNADFNKKLNKNEFSYGFEFNHNNVNSSAYKLNISNGARSALDTRYPDGGSQIFSAAAFFSHRYQFNGKWALNEGIRLSYADLHSKFNDQTFFPFPFNVVNQRNTALSGNLNLVYKPAADWKLVASGSTGFRAPNVDDLSKVFESAAGSVVVPNPNLKPEYTYNAEMGLEKKYSSKATINLNGFYTWYRNAITTQPFLFNGQSQIQYDGQLSDVTANVNAQKAYLYGFSGELTFIPAKNMVLRNNATYTYARITSVSPQQPLDHIPPFMGLSSIEYAYKKYQAEFFVQYNSHKKLEDYNLNGEDNLPQATLGGMPSWYTLNFRSGYDLNKNLKLQMALENILDRNYRVFASGISAPGRNFIVSLRGSF